MKFGWLAVGEARGAILAHGIRAGSRHFKKGRLLGGDDVEALAGAGIERVMAARLEDGDVPENDAAERIARALAGDHISVGAAFTGRANLLAGARGLAVIDEARIERINLLHEALTVATLEPMALVEPRQIIATIKIIPFAAPESIISEAEAIAGDGGPVIAIAPLKPCEAALVMTSLQQTKDKVLAKTRSSVIARIEALGGRLADDSQCGHDEASVAAAVRACADQGLSPILIFGGTAIVDRRDVIPAGIERAGGTIIHFGMPVDPGNLLLLAEYKGTPVIGLPGCARSLKLNGFDWILRRVVAGLTTTREDIMRMGAGGLLKDFAGRPQPREVETGAAATRAPKVAAIILAAGQSRRMGEINKLLEEVDGASMIARTVDAALSSHADRVIVVTGHQAARVHDALAGHAVEFVDNPDFAEGLSGSLLTGLDALPGEVDGAVVCLGDMPYIRARHIDQLIAAFDPLEGRSICVPTYRGKHGNPVLWSRAFFAAMRDLTGDVGAKHLIGENSEQMCEVAIDEEAIFTDIDTPGALRAARGEAVEPE